MIQAFKSPVNGSMMGPMLVMILVMLFNVFLATRLKESKMLMDN